LTSKGGGGISQVFSTMKVLAIDLAFTTICDLLIGGMPFCDKVATNNKDIFTFDLFFMLGPFHNPMYLFAKRLLENHRVYGQTYKS